jgi:hypothetical protein
MLEILAACTLFFIAYPFLEEWRQRRFDKRRLADMRRHFAARHRWDALQGRWIDD